MLSVAHGFLAFQQHLIVTCRLTQLTTTVWPFFLSLALPLLSSYWSHHCYRKYTKKKDKIRLVISLVRMLQLKVCLSNLQKQTFLKIFFGILSRTALNCNLAFKQKQLILKNHTVSISF